MNEAIVAAIAACILLVVELARKGFNYLLDKDKPQLTQSDLDTIKQTKKKIDDIDDSTTKLLEMHSKVDNNGVPLWYMPREMQSAQSETINLLSEISHSNKSCIKVIEKVADVLEKIDRRQDKVEDAIERIEKKITKT